MPVLRKNFFTQKKKFSYRDFEINVVLKKSCSSCYKTAP